MEDPRVDPAAPRGGGEKFDPTQYPLPDDMTTRFQTVNTFLEEEKTEHDFLVDSLTCTDATRLFKGTHPKNKNRKLVTVDAVIAELEEFKAHGTTEESVKLRSGATPIPKAPKQAVTALLAVVRAAEHAVKPPAIPLLPEPSPADGSRAPPLLMTLGLPSWQQVLQSAPTRATRTPDRTKLNTHGLDTYKTRNTSNAP